MRICPNIIDDFFGSGQFGSQPCKLGTRESYLKPQRWKTEWGCPEGKPYMPSKHAFNALQFDMCVLPMPRMHALHAWLVCPVYLGMPRFIPQARTSHVHCMIWWMRHKSHPTQAHHPPTRSSTPETLTPVDKFCFPNKLLWRPVRVYLNQVALHIWISKKLWIYTVSLHKHVNLFLRARECANAYYVTCQIWASQKQGRTPPPRPLPPTRVG